MHDGSIQEQIAVIMNGARNAPTELEMEGFVMIIKWKVSSNQKQAKDFLLINLCIVVVCICCLFCRVTIECPCAVQRVAEDLLLSKSVARGPRSVPPLFRYHCPKHSLLCRVEYYIICSTIIST